MLEPLFIFLLSATTAVAQNPAGKDSKPFIRPTELLKCKTPSAKEENRVREAAESANFSDHEVLARLIFSESLSTGYWSKSCFAPNAQALMEAIGWGVMNRVAKYSPNRNDPKPDAIFHVVFAQRQFRTSFSAYKDNPFAKAFLCPMEAEKYLKKVEASEDPYDIYSMAKEVAAKILDKYQRDGIDPAFAHITHFFYPQSEFGGSQRPTWAKDPVPTKNKGYLPIISGEKPCAEFYRR